MKIRTNSHDVLAYAAVQQQYQLIFEGLDRQPWIEGAKLGAGAHEVFEQRRTQ